MRMLEQDGLKFPDNTPQEILDEALKCIPPKDTGYAYPLMEHIRTDLLCYAMVVSEGFAEYMYSFYKNTNYLDDVLVIKTRIDFRCTNENPESVYK